MRQEKILPTFLVFILLCLFLFLINGFGLTKPIISLGESITNPIRKVFYRTNQGLVNAFSNLSRWNNSANEILKLQQDVRDYSSLKVKLKVLEEENRALRKQLEAPLPANMKFIPARTLGLSRYLTIDKGENDGIKIGMTVISENILVGKIVKTTPKTAQIILPTDPDSRIPGQTLSNGARGLISGEFGTEVIFDKVMQTDTLEKDDLVITLGDGGYTKDLLIGKISQIIKKDIEPFQKAEIILLLDFNKLKNIFVIE
ncbi:MAG: rod shape-determining protein MreC [Candidatus Gottesmanbacteria bacterium]